jgi:putative peptidoglycan lipid II flippase
VTTGTPHRTRSLAGAAMLIGVITVLARLAGFGRTVVFSQTVGKTCLGQVYFTANQVPNIVFEIVAGGALASMVVPVLAGPIERGEHGDVRRTASALLTWVLVVLVPLSLVGAVAARPIMDWLVPSGSGTCTRTAVISVGTHMLVVFAPQILLYGIVVVLYGVLQAHRRFTGPAVAPLVSSVVVIAAYLAYVPLGHGHAQDLAALPKPAELMLSVGTTAGVAALVVTAGFAVLPLRLRLRPTLHFPAGVAARVRHLAMAGLATVAAQQISALVVVVLSNWRGTNSLVDYQYAWAVFLLPWAILAVPIATSAFPLLSAKINPKTVSNGRAGGAQSEHSERGGREDCRGEMGGVETSDPPRQSSRPIEDGFDPLVASTTRAVLLASCGGVAGLVAVALPVAHFLDHGSQPMVLARAILTFAPGLIGYGFVAHLGRVLYACHRGRASAGATVTGWAAVIVADLVLVALVPGGWVVAGLGIGNTIGMTVAGVALLAALVRERGRASIAGLGRAMLAGLAGAAAGGVAGYAVAAAAGSTGRLESVGVAAAAGIVAILVFALVTFAISGRDLISSAHIWGRKRSL